MRHALLVTIFFLFACGGILGSPLEQVEGAYRNRITDLAGIEAAATDPDLKRRAREARELHEAAYLAAPTSEDARVEAIGQINMASNGDIVALQEELDDHIETAKQRLLASWKGGWKADKHVLNIDAEGGVHYENNAGSMKKTIDAYVVELTQDELVIGALGMNSTFQIDQQPTKAADGTWSMKLDGEHYVWLGL